MPAADVIMHGTQHATYREANPDPELVAAYQLLMDRDPHYDSLTEAARSKNFMVVHRDYIEALRREYLTNPILQQAQVIPSDGKSPKLPYLPR